MVETFSALAEPNRLRIVDLLLRGPRTVNAIGEKLELAQPQVSKHLKVLKEARLVEVEPQGQQRLYGLDPHALRQLDRWLERYRRLWDERFSQLDDVIAKMKERQR
jgi:DNA-binding transcriptional ArsR family regulator